MINNKKIIINIHRKRINTFKFNTIYEKQLLVNKRRTYKIFI